VSGRHAGQAGVGKNVLFLSYLATLVLIPAAMIAAFVCLIIFGTPLELQAFVVLAFAAGLVNVVRRKPRELLRVALWTSVTALLTVDIVSTFAHEHRWPEADQGLISHVRLIGIIVLTALLATRLLMAYRQWRIGRPRT
jgi:uncharacterized membrane protein YjjP (DUF1212 family)